MDAVPVQAVRLDPRVDLTTEVEIDEDGPAVPEEWPNQDMAPP